MNTFIRIGKGLIFICLMSYTMLLSEITISFSRILLGRKTCDRIIDYSTLHIARIFRLLYRMLHNTRVIIDTNITLPPRTTHLVLSSHKGASDFFVLSLLLPSPPRFIAKRELARSVSFVNIPCISKTLRMQDHAIINRKNKIESLKKIQYFSHLQTQRKNNMLLFPEGTRNKDTLTKPFFSSAIKIILKNTNIPVALVALSEGHKTNSYFNVTQNSILRAKIMGIYIIEHLTELEEKIIQFRQIINTQLLEWEKEDSAYNNKT